MGRWKLSFGRSTPSSSPSTSINADVPPEFLCPISRSLMADPVILPTDHSGHSFDRPCIQACARLAFTPPQLPGNIDLTGSPVLIPNVGLRTAILSWCDRSGVPPPIPVPLDAALAIVRGLMDCGKGEAFRSPAVGGGRVGDEGDAFGRPVIDSDRFGEKGDAFGASSFGSGQIDVKGGSFGPQAIDYDRFGEKDDAFDEKAGSFGNPAMSIGRIDEKGDGFPSKSRQQPGSPNTPLPISMRSAKKSSSSSFASTASIAFSSSSSSSYPSTDIPIDGPLSQEISKAAIFTQPTPEIDDVEEEIHNKLRNPELFDQEATTSQLRQLTREGPDRRLALCTPRLLAVLRPLLLLHSRAPDAVQVNATAALVNLSLEPKNKTKIVRSGVVPSLVDVLKSPNAHPDAKDNAAGALFSLALDDEHRVAIGVLGAVPPLLFLFARPNAANPLGRRDAGMALYHLSLAGANRSKLAQTPGAVRALLAVAGERRDDDASSPGPSLARLAMMILCSLASCSEGRGALMDGGAVAAVVELVRTGVAADAGAEDQCVAALHAMSRGSLRFRGLARAAGAERVLARVAEAAGGSGSAGDESRRELARRTLRAIRGEDDGVRGVSAGTVKSLPIRYREDYDVVGGDSVTESNSTAF